MPKFYRIDVHAWKCVCTCTYTCVHTYVYTYTYMKPLEFFSFQALFAGITCVMQSEMCVHVYTHMCTHICIYIYIHEAFGTLVFPGTFRGNHVCNAIRNTKNMHLFVEGISCILWSKLCIFCTCSTEWRMSCNQTCEYFALFQGNYIQPIADRVALNLEIILETFQRTRILHVGFTISTR